MVTQERLACAARTAWWSCANGSRFYINPIEARGVAPEQGVAVGGGKIAHRPRHRAHQAVIADAQTGDREIRAEDTALHPEDRKRVAHNRTVGVIIPRLVAQPKFRNLQMHVGLARD